MCSAMRKHRVKSTDSSNVADVGPGRVLREAFLLSARNGRDIPAAKRFAVKRLAADLVNLFDYLRTESPNSLGCVASS